jgi:hypothetical protein
MTLRLRKEKSGCRHTHIDDSSEETEGVIILKAKECQG